MHKFLQHTLSWLAATFLVTGCASPNPFNMPTFNPETVRQDMPAYINQVVDMLRSTRLLRP